MPYVVGYVVAWLRAGGGDWVVFHELTGQLMLKRDNLNHSSETPCRFS
jgi:hypothetical protein